MKIENDPDIDELETYSNKIKLSYNMVGYDLK